MGSHQQIGGRKKLAEVALALAGYVSPEEKEQRRIEETEAMAEESSEELFKGTKRQSGGFKPIEVMYNNWDTARVYELCDWELLGVGMAEKPLYWQIPATEILAVCRLLRIPRKKWKKITNEIKLIMQPVAKVYFNKGEVVI